MLHLTWIIRIVFVINVKLQLSIDWCYYKANINIFQDLTRPAKQNKPFITFPGLLPDQMTTTHLPAPHQCRHASDVQSNVNLKPLVNCHNIITITEINYQIHHFHYR